jgi:poly(3-hydroxybutyrate) depolymerase
MSPFRVFAFACAALVTASAQTLPTAEQQPDTQTLAAAVRVAIRSTPADARAEVDRLFAEGTELQRAGRSGEMRRRLAQAVALMTGRKWDRQQEFAWSLALRPDRIVTEPGEKVSFWLTQFYPAPLPVTGLPRVRATLLTGPSVINVGTFDIVSTDLIDRPYGVQAVMPNGIPGPKSGRLRAELMEGDTVSATVEVPVQIAPGIVSRRAEVEERLLRIQGHESTKASIRFPYVLADTVNSGQRSLNEGDFGIPFTPQPVAFDFAAALRRSDELLAALQSGKDPLWQARGDHQRHYWFPEAHEMMPYRVYVPHKWDGRSRLPMVLVLHGATRDENFYFDRDGGILAKLAEEHGYLVVCPLGYRPTAGWGASAMSPNPAAIGAVRMRQTELSEKDALRVLELVNQEFPIDSSRTYLFGHSMGGGGTWYLGQKFPQRWAAIAASASGIAGVTPEQIPYGRLKDVPLMVIVGDKDPAATNVRATVRLAKEHGLDPYFLEVPGATHETIVALAEPRVFDFFDRHRRP